MEKPGARLRKEKILTCLLSLYLHNPIFRLIQSLALLYIYIACIWRNKIFNRFIYRRVLYVIGEIDNWREFNKEKLKSFEDATSEWMKFQKRLNEANEINEKGKRERGEKRTKIQAMITGQGWQNGIKRIRGEGRAWLPLSADPADSSTTFCSVANCRHE